MQLFTNLIVVLGLYETGLSKVTQTKKKFEVRRSFGSLPLPYEDTGLVSRYNDVDTALKVAGDHQVFVLTEHGPCKVWPDEAWKWGSKTQDRPATIGCRDC